MDAGWIILLVSVLSVGAILAGAAGQKIDAPILLVFLLAGMLAGPEGPGGIRLDAADATLVWGSAALAAILFEGGLQSNRRTFQLGLRPGLSLAVAGTLLTALILTPAAAWAFGIGWLAAFLFAAVVSSTDAAAVFALASTGVRMSDRVAATLEVESGFNDPLAILLVVGLAEAAAGQTMGAWGWMSLFAVKATLGGAIGVGLGYLAPVILKRVNLPAGLTAILLAGFGFIAFGLAETLGGSGFLAVYAAGAVIALTAPDIARASASVVEGLAWLAQTGLFLMLGLLVTPSHLATIAAPAALAALALIFVARPAATVISLAPFGFRARETVFISWTGLRGATPVFLGLLPAALGAPNGAFYVSAAAVVVLMSLVIQGWTAPMVARLLQMDRLADLAKDRGEGLARLGAVAASLLVGSWFAWSLNGTAPPLALARPADVAELSQALDNPALAIGALPGDLAALPDQTRQGLYVRAMRSVVGFVNAEIEADRAALAELEQAAANRGRLSLEEEERLAAIARRYDLGYGSPRALLAAIDIVPADLGAAQSVIATGWGASANALERNALFGRSAFEDAPDSVRDLAALYASHPGFEAFRQARAAARAEGRTPEAAELAPHLAAFAADGQAYVRQLEAVLASLPARIQQTGGQQTGGQQTGGQQTGGQPTPAPFEEAAAPPTPETSPTPTPAPAGESPSGGPRRDRP